MANLLDIIRQNSAGMQAPGMTDQSQQVANLLRAKSGKAVGGPDVGPSSLAEAAAVGSAQQQMRNEVLPQAQIQQQQLEGQMAGQEQQAGIEKANIAQQTKFNTIQNKLRTTQLLNEFEQDRGKLDLAKNKAGVEQFAQGLRLQNQKYISDLQREGARKRLDTEIGFNEELVRSAFGANKDLLEKQLKGRSILGANDREFNKAMGQMTIDDAWKAFKSEQRRAKDMAAIEAIGGVSQAGLGAASNANDQQMKKDYYTTGGGANDTSYEASKYRDVSED